MVIKLILIGDPLVGKTLLRNRLFGTAYNKGYMNTIGGEFSIMDIPNEYGLPSKAQVWELNSQKRFKKLRSKIYVTTHAILVVYDISNPESFENVPLWIEESQQTTGIIPIVIIANKIDLRKSNTNFITTEQGMNIVKRVEKEFLQNKLKVPFIETSAITGEMKPPKFDLAVEGIGGPVVVSIF